MKYIGKTSKILKIFITMVKNHLEKVVKAVRRHSGTKFTSRPMRNFYIENGNLCQKVLHPCHKKKGRLKGNILIS